MEIGKPQKRIYIEPLSIPVPSRERPLEAPQPPQEVPQESPELVPVRVRVPL